MSALVMGRVFYAPLAAPLKLTLLALADHAEDDGTRVFVGQTRLAEKDGCSERTVRRAVTALEQAGYLIAEPRRGAHGTNHYRIAVEKLESRPATIVADRPDWPTGHSGHVDRTNPARRPDTAVSAKPSGEPSVTTRERARATRLPAVFALTDERRTYAQRQGCRDPGRMLEDFADYWRGTGKPMLDWDAVYRRWARSAHDGSSKACGCGAAKRSPPARPMAAGGVPMRTAEETAQRLRDRARGVG